MKRYIQFYDNHGLQMLASDSIMPFDNRLSNKSALSLAYKKTQKQALAWKSNKDKYIKPRQCYAVVMRKAAGYNGAHDMPVSEIHFLENPCFEDEWETARAS